MTLRKKSIKAWRVVKTMLDLNCFILCKGLLNSNSIWKWRIRLTCICFTTVQKFVLTSCLDQHQLGESTWGWLDLGLEQLVPLWSVEVSTLDFNRVFLNKNKSYLLYFQYFKKINKQDQDSNMVKMLDVRTVWTISRFWFSKTKG